MIFENYLQGESTKPTLCQSFWNVQSTLDYVKGAVVWIINQRIDHSLCISINMGKQMICSSCLVDRRYRVFSSPNLKYLFLPSSYFKS